MHNSSNKVDPAPLEVSVVICTYNRAPMLQKALDSVTRQRIPSGRFEVVVVDDGSSDDTSDVIQQACRNSAIEVRYFKQANSGIGRARNRGSEEARAPWIAFIDDDEIASEFWLSELLETARVAEADCVGGPCILETTETGGLQPVGTIRKLLGENLCMSTPSIRLSFLNRMQTRAARLDTPGGGNVLVRRALLQTLGGFRLLRYGEDLDFFRRARQNCAVIAIAHKAVIHHILPSERLTYSYLSSLAVRAGKSQASIDFRDAGQARPYVMAALRLAHLIVVTWPLLNWHRLLGHESLTVSRQCSLKFAVAYLREVGRHSLGPGEQYEGSL